MSRASTWTRVREKFGGNRSKESGRSGASYTSKNNSSATHFSRSVQSPAGSRGRPPVGVWGRSRRQMLISSYDGGGETRTHAMRCPSPPLLCTGSSETLEIRTSFIDFHRSLIFNVVSSQPSKPFLKRSNCFVLGYIYNLHHKGTHVIITHFMETGIILDLPLGKSCVPSSSVHIRCRAAEIRQLIGHGCCDAILHNLVDSLKRS